VPAAGTAAPPPARTVKDLAAPELGSATALIACVETFAQDLRFAIRQLAKHPGFTFTAVLVLALGLGANTAIFTVVNAFMLRPLPYKDPARLMGLFERDPIDIPGGDPTNEVSPGNYLDWQRMSTSFEQIAAASDGGAFNVSSPSNAFEPQRVDGCTCASNLFSTLGVQPILGRAFRADEDRWGAPRVAVLGYGLWQRRFGASKNVIGKQIRVDGALHQIVGVMPRGFAFPYRTDEIYVPLLQNVPPELQKIHDSHFLYVLGRLRPGVSREAARAEIDGFARRYRHAHPNEVSGKGGNVIPWQTYLVQDVRTSLLVLFAAVGCVLLIACVNVANLLLTRASSRTREVAIREAIGASRSRIVRQLLTESILLAVLGSAAGLLMAAFVTEALVQHAPAADGIIPPGALSADPLVFLFAFAIALLTGAAAGLFPALQSSRTDVAKSLKDNTRSATMSRSQGRFRNVLVAAEVALSMILLVSAVLLLRSFSRLYQVKTGVRINNTLTLGIEVPDMVGDQAAKVAAFLRQLSRGLQSVPGVLSAGVASCPPVGGHCSDAIFNIEGHPLPPGQFMDALNRAADPRYFESAGIPLLRGRTFTGQDGIGFDKQHPRKGAAIISEALVKKDFGKQDPLGKYLSFPYESEVGRVTPRYEIVGVVGDVPERLDAEIEPTIYVPILDGKWTEVYIVLHTSVEPHSVTSAVRAEIHRLDPDLPLFKIRTMQDVLGYSASDRQFNMVLFSSFAGLALLLAAVGLYGVLSYSVSQRQSEIGIRLALGADRSSVRALVLRQGMKPALIGIAAGLLGAIFAAQAMKTLLFNVTPSDPATFILVPLILLATTLLACYLPSARATRIDPASALRIE
jgi:predicted permease